MHTPFRKIIGLASGLVIAASCILFGLYIYTINAEAALHHHFLAPSDDAGVVTLSGNSENIYVIGDVVTVASDTVGDIYTVSDSLHIPHIVEGDIGFLGITLVTDGNIMGDVRSISDSIVVHGEVDGEVMFLGRSLVVEKDSVIRKDILSLAQNISIHGTVHGDIHMRGGSLSVYGTVHGDIYAENVRHIIIHSGATAGNNIFYTHHTEKTLEVESGAIVTGDTIMTRKNDFRADDFWHDNLMALLFLIVAGVLAYCALGKRWNRFICIPPKHTLISTFFGVVCVLVALIIAIVFLLTRVLWIFSLAAFSSFAVIVFVGIISSPVSVGACVQYLYNSIFMRDKIQVTSIGEYMNHPNGKEYVTFQSTMIGVILLFISSLFSWLVTAIIFILAIAFFIGALTNLFIGQYIKDE